CSYSKLLKNLKYTATNANTIVTNPTSHLITDNPVSSSSLTTISTWSSFLTINND
ncbi:unnamed protein product, partial [Rotaria sp. Silwood2]